MVQAIKYVHNAAMSIGTGVYDFEADMAELHPAVYFVNDDASKLDGRVDLCKRLGVEMVVATRAPADGLEVCVCVRACPPLHSPLLGRTRW